MSLKLSITWYTIVTAAQICRCSPDNSYRGAVILSKSVRVQNPSVFFHSLYLLIF